MILLKDFNRRFTVRRLAEFGEPEVKSLAKLEFARGTVLHYLDPDCLEFGPPGTLYHLSDLEKPARMRHHIEMRAENAVGLPIEIKRDIKEDVLSFHRKWKKIKRLKDPRLLSKDNKIVLVENYTPILRRYRYNDKINVWYDKSHNLLNTLIRGLLDSVTEYPERQHYIPVNVPSYLPTRKRFEKMAKTKTEQAWEGHTEFEMLILVELYQWLSDDRAESMFSEIGSREARHVNFLLQFNGNFVNINLGELDGWRKEGREGKVPPEQMVKRFRETIRILMETPAVSGNIKVTPEGKGVDVTAEEEPQGEVDFQDNEDIIEDEIERFETKEIEDVELSVAEVEEDDIVVNTDDDSSVSAIVERDLEQIKQVSPKRHDRFLRLFGEVENLESPYGGSYGEELANAENEIVIEKEKFIDDPTIIEDSWNGSRTKIYTEEYNTKRLKTDVIKITNSLQKFGMVITGHEMEEKLDAGGHREYHKLRVQLLDGTNATIPFILPKVDKDGYWTSNGVKYTMRKQRVDVPIRKVSPSEVALTSFYGKLFISTSEQAVVNWGEWVRNEITVRGVDMEDPTITNVSFSNVFDHKEKLPRDYTTVAMKISSFDSKGFHYNFDHTKINDVFDEKEVKQLKKENLVPVAKSKKVTLAMDERSAMYKLEDGKITPAERLIEQLGLPLNKEPRPHTDVDILGKSIPLGLILSYYLGLKGLMKETGTEYKFFPPGEKPRGDGIVLSLKEGKLEIYPKSYEEELLFNCFVRYKDQLKTLLLRDLETKSSYALLLQKNKLGTEYLTELDLLEKGFVDAIHEKLLKKIGEPTGFKKLLIRANSLLVSHDHPRETDIEYMHIFSNHRLAGHLYTEVAKAMRRYHNSPPSTRKLDIKPKAVWGRIDNDPSVLTAQDANAIQSIKEQDVVTMGGSNGRSRRSMVKHTREYDAKELGIISGDTVDNADVGITALASNDPNIVDIDGMVKIEENLDNLEFGQLLSFYNSLAPDVNVDDSKRGNFVNIQMGSATQALHGHCPPYRTGSEKLVAHRASDYYANIAKDDGKVIDLDEHGVRVKYADGTEEVYSLGRWYGSYEGTNYPHDKVPHVKKGQKFSKGDVLAYCSESFEPDIMNPTQVNWRNGVICNVALINGEEVYEDSDEISEDKAKELTTRTTKIKDVVVNSEQSILNLLNEGTVVEYDSTLCLIDDTNDYGGFSNEAIETLQDLSTNSPRAGAKGTIDKIEVIYNGELDMMSETLQSIIRKGDRRRRKEAKASQVPKAETGRVDEEFRTGGSPLIEGQVLIRFYITGEHEMIGGDKVVVANQMKSVVRGRMVGKNESVTGRKVHLKFGREGVDNRIVGSLYRMGLGTRFSMGLAEGAREIRDS
jgi:hypothetical protein